MNIPSREACQPTQLQAFLSDTLTDDEQTLMFEHLDRCADCRRQMETFAGEADVWESVRGALAKDELGDRIDSELQGVVPPVEWTQAPVPGKWELAWVEPWLGKTLDPDALGRIGPFEVLKIIGAGGMGVVFLAKEPSLGREVAIKVLAPHLAKFPIARQRFEREARATAGLIHDNIIAIHQVSEWNALPYLVMQYLPESSLQAYLEEHGKMDLELAIELGLHVAQGLVLAHSRGIIHRDIKPANILLANGAQRAILSDFGLARIDDEVTLTKTGMMAGTPHYMSPEQARGEAVDQRSDLFSLGSVLYTMLIGRPPMPSASDSLSGVPPWFATIMDRLHDVDKERRPSSAEVVVEWLQQALAHLREPSSHRPPTVSTGAKAIGSGYGRRIFIGMFLLAIISFGFMAFPWWPDEKQIEVPQQAPKGFRWAYIEAELTPTAYDLVSVRLIRKDDTGKEGEVVLPAQNVVSPREVGKHGSEPWFMLALGQRYEVQSIWRLRGNFEVDRTPIQLTDILDWDAIRYQRVTLSPPERRELH